MLALGVPLDAALPLDDALVADELLDGLVDDGLLDALVTDALLGALDELAAAGPVGPAAPTLLLAEFTDVLVESQPAVSATSAAPSVTRARRLRCTMLPLAARARSSSNRRWCSVRRA